MAQGERSGACGDPCVRKIVSERDSVAIGDDTLERARTHHRAGDIAAAEAIYRTILAAHPAHAETLHLLGVVFLQKDDPAEAARLIRLAIEGEPEHPKFHSNLGNALLALERLDEAEQSLRRALEHDPLFAEAHHNLGVVLQRCARLTDAESAYRAALDCDETLAGTWNNLGNLLQARRDLDEAAACCARATELQPDDHGLAANYATVLEMLNRTDEARDIATRILAADADHPIANFVTAVQERRRGKLDSARNRLERVLAGELPGELRANTEAEYGQVLDRLGRTDEAFAAFSRSNAAAVQAWQGRFDKNWYTEVVQRNRAWTTAERIAAWPRPTDEGPRPIFFVGFPRSGTTLMERMLARHPHLAAISEKSALSGLRTALPDIIGRAIRLPEGLDGLTDDELTAIRSWYRRRSAELAGADDRRIADKLPLNIIRLGEINRVFPDAQAIVALRDPRDVALSCFMQSFGANSAMANFHDLADTARFYDAVMGLWRHYREVLTLEWLEYRYEDLAREPEPTLRRVIEFLGEPWHDAVLDHQHDAIGTYIETPSRRDLAAPITGRAVGRWQAYAHHLAPVLPVRAPYVEAFGYAQA